MIPGNIFCLEHFASERTEILALKGGKQQLQSAQSKMCTGIDLNTTDEFRVSSVLMPVTDTIPSLLPSDCGKHISMFAPIMRYLH